MKPAARVQAAIDIVDLVVAAAERGGASADRIASDWFRARRFVGSKDRRAIRDLAWSAIRACGPRPVSGRAALLRLARLDETILPLFDGSPYGPGPYTAGEPVADGGVAPAWLAERLEASGIGGDAQSALLARAPLDIRVNRLKATREGLSADLPVAAELTAAPDGLRLPFGTPAESWPAFEQGLFEVQDAGSQLACAALDAQPGETVVDLCAGAGGKTLALAAAMQNTGRLVACDIDRARLSRLAPRAVRAGASVETRLLDAGREKQGLADLAGTMDAVLVDAPCSGTGTWRRNPEARWRLSPVALERFAAMQDHVLELAAGLVRPGGRLTYVVCSLLDAEGSDRMAAYLAARPDWQSVAVECPLGAARGPGWRLDPYNAGTDGFFFATARSLC